VSLVKHLDDSRLPRPHTLYIQVYHTASDPWHKSKRKKYRTTSDLDAVLRVHLSMLIPIGDQSNPNCDHCHEDAKGKLYNRSHKTYSVTLCKTCSDKLDEDEWEGDENICTEHNGPFDDNDGKDICKTCEDWIVQ
jgi:hypothetical protein